MFQIYFRFGVTKIDFNVRDNNKVTKSGDQLKILKDPLIFTTSNSSISDPKKTREWNCSTPLQGNKTF